MYNCRYMYSHVFIPTSGFNVMCVTRKSNVITWEKDVTVHCNSKSHLEQAKALKAQPKHPFSISVDGSNDTELEKMNSITVDI